MDTACLIYFPIQTHWYILFFFVTSVDSIQYATGIVDPYSVQDVCTVMNIVYGLALHQSLHRSVDGEGARPVFGRSQVGNLSATLITTFMTSWLSYLSHPYTELKIHPLSLLQTNNTSSCFGFVIQSYGCGFTACWSPSSTSSFSKKQELSSSCRHPLLRY